MQIKVICILLNVSFLTKGLIVNFIPVWPRRIIIYKFQTNMKWKKEIQLFSSNLHINA